MIFRLERRRGRDKENDTNGKRISRGVAFQLFRKGSLQVLFASYWLLCASTILAASEWRSADGDAEVIIDTQRTGQIKKWRVHGRDLVNQPEEVKGPLQLLLANGTSATFEPTAFREEKHDTGTRLIIDGKLSGDPFSLAAEVAYDVSPDIAQIRVTISTQPSDAPATLVASWKWSLPFTLSPRKRVYFRGEYALDWETRYFYQFLTRFGEFYPHPDRNEWRWFGLDQLGPKAFRLWKAESEAASALVMQEGHNLPPYAQVYDPDRGVTIEYPNLAEYAPKTLRIDASAGAMAEIQLWPLIAGPTKAQTFGLFGVPHEIILTASSDEKSVLTKRTELNAKYPAASLPDAAKVLDEPAWLRSTPLSQNVPQYVTGGYPFPKGLVKDQDSIQVSVAGEKVHCQPRPIGYWPDGSLKWVLLTFPIDPKKAVPECAPPYVTLRTGGCIPVQISIAAEKSSTRPATGAALTATEQKDGSILIENGPLAVKLAKGSQWLAVSLHNKPILSPAKDSRLAYADYLLDAEPLFPFTGTQKGGKEDRGTLSIDKLTLEQNGPLQAVVRLEGMVNNQEPTRVIMRVKVEAGRPEIQLTHTAEFLFHDPRRTFLSDLGIELPLGGFDLGKARFGTADGQDALGALALIQETPFARKLLHDHQNTLEATAIQGDGGWIEASGQNLRFIGAVRNFVETAPKAISITEDKTNVRFEIWPRKAGVMDVRRYSNHPHLIQGEATTTDEDWVQKDYYANEPFFGVSRTHEMLFGFWPADAAPNPESVAADFQSPPLLYAGWERYASTGVILSEPLQKDWPAAWNAWTQFTRFWLYHRSLHSWYGFWNFGDIRHQFQSGYGAIFQPSVLVEGLTHPESFANTPAQYIQDYHPPNDWAFDNGRWGWSNCEGLGNLFFQREYLRHGNRVVYFAAEAQARLSRDVVVRQEGKWFGKGTRHGVQHWSDGNHEERQTTSTEYRLHYFLSGDDRTRDVINKLYDQYYSQTEVSVMAAHSARLGGLLFHWETTGSPLEAAQLKGYVHSFIAPNGLFLSPHVKFPGPVNIGEPGDLNSGSMWLNNYGGMHNLFEYQQITEDPKLADAIIKMAGKAIAMPEVQEMYRSGKYDDHHVYYPVISFAAIHAKDPTPFRNFLVDWVQSAAWKNLYQTVSNNPAHWSGPTAFLTGGMPLSLFWSNWAPYITYALGKDTILTPAIMEQIERSDKDGGPEQPAPSSWQTDLDGVPGMSDYLDSQKPWVPTTTKVNGVQTFR